MDNCEFTLSPPAISGFDADHIKVNVSFKKDEWEIESINDIPVFIKDIIDLRGLERKIRKDTELESMVADYIYEIRSHVDDIIDTITGLKQDR